MKTARRWIVVTLVGWNQNKREAEAMRRTLMRIAREVRFADDHAGWAPKPFDHIGGDPGCCVFCGCDDRQSPVTSNHYRGCPTLLAVETLAKLKPARAGRSRRSEARAVRAKARSSRRCSSDI